MLFKTIIFALLACFLMFIGPSWALDVKSVRVGGHGEKERLVVELSGKSQFRAFVLQSPDRIIIDLDDFNWKVGTMSRPPVTLVKDVRFGSLGGGKGRLVIETATPRTLITRVTSRSSWVLTWGDLAFREASRQLE